VQKLRVAGTVGKVATAAHPQGLVDGLFEAVVALLDVAVFVRLAGCVGGGLQSIMGHQGLVALGELLAAAAVEHMDGRAEIVGAMERGHAAELPETGFQALGQRLEALGEANLDGFDVGIGQH